MIVRQGLQKSHGRVDGIARRRAVPVGGGLRDGRVDGGPVVRGDRDVDVARDGAGGAPRGLSFGNDFMPQDRDALVVAVTTCEIAGTTRSHFDVPSSSPGERSSWSPSDPARGGDRPACGRARRFVHRNSLRRPGRVAGAARVTARGEAAHAGAAGCRSAPGSRPREKRRPPDPVQRRVLPAPPVASMRAQAGQDNGSKNARAQGYSLDGLIGACSGGWAPLRGLSPLVTGRPEPDHSRANAGRRRSDLYSRRAEAQAGREGPR